MKRLRLSLALLGAGTACTALPAAAQIQQNIYREDAGTALTRHLRTLSEQPRSVSALMGAGKAALELGDPQAALTFFARAEEISPRDGYVKAGMGSAFVAMEQPRTALRLFQEAAGLGVAEAEFAGDRGLVHDLAGDPRRAQADYSLSLSRREDDEVRRRLALSLAISGDRDRALAAIEGQLRRQDRAAWRTRAFILALAGDAMGATQVAQSTMPMQAAQLQPFFARLPALNAAQRAMAVHFGHFPEGAGSLPATGTQYASAVPSVAASRPNPTQAGRPDPRQAPLGTRQQQPARPRSVASANPSLTRSAPRQAERQSRSRQSAMDWARGYSRESGSNVATRPARDASQNAARPSVAATAQRDQARGTTQVFPQRPIAGPVNSAGLVRNPPTGSPPAAAQPVPQVQRAPLQLAEARPAPATIAPAPMRPIVPSQNVPLQTAPAQSAPGANAPLQTTTGVTAPVQAGPARPASTQNLLAQNAPAQLPPAVTPPPASSVQSSPVAPSLALSPTEQPRQPEAAAPALPAPSTIFPSISPNASALQAPAQSSSSIANLTLPPSEPAQQDVMAPAPQQPSTASSPQQPRARRFADIAATIASLPGDPAPAQAPSTAEPRRQVLARLEPKVAAPAPAPRAEPAAETPKPASASKPKQGIAKAAAVKEPASDKPSSKAEASKKDASAKKPPAEPKQASRHWVQIAGGANEAAMTSEFNRLKGKAPKLLGGRIAWTTPLRATNRLLVGPFKTPKEAQDFVNELAKLDLSAFSWTSPAGQEIAKLSAK